jgi:hypothetical protein
MVVLSCFEHRVFFSGLHMCRRSSRFLRHVKLQLVQLPSVSLQLYLLHLQVGVAVCT